MGIGRRPQGPQMTNPKLAEAVHTLGDTIAHFRKRHRRPLASVAWTQEDLALACGTDQAHISRIESNQRIPLRSTLIRICDVLELSKTERAYVLSLAGHQEISPLPDSREVECVLTKLVPILESFPYPSMLVDEGERMWHFNRFAVALHGDCFGVFDRERFLKLVRGKRYLELIFCSELSETWEVYWEDPNFFASRLIALFWRAYHTRPLDPDMNRLLERLKKNPEFLHRWEEVERGEVDVLFVEHARYTMRHPELGLIQYNAWRTHVAANERFLVTHCTPIDSATGRIFDRLANICRVG
jgi:transcriptional regulator with XRE-family HTH domain